METIVLAIVAVFLLVIAVYLILLLLELKKAVIFLRNIENLNPALEELILTLKSIRNISDNVNAVTVDVKEVADSLNAISLGAIGFIDTLKSSALVRALSLKAGVTAGLTYFLTNVLRKGDRQ